MRKSFSTSILRVSSLAILFFSILNSFSSVSSKNATKKICETKECLSAAQNLKESIDFEADPCEDFYQYACGNWPNVHKNENGSYIAQDTFVLRSHENMAELGDFIRQNNSKNEPEAVHKARSFYYLCLNEAAYDNKLERIVPTLQEIGLSAFPFLSARAENFDFTTALAKASKLAGVDMFFQLTANLHPNNQTLSRFILNNIKETPNLPNTTTSQMSKERISEAQFMDDVMKKMCNFNSSIDIECVLWIYSPDNTTKDSTIKNILTQQDEIRQINLEIDAKPADPVLLTLKELQNLTDSISKGLNSTIPKLNWTKYIEETFAGLDTFKLNLNDPSKIEISTSNSIAEIIRYIYKKNNLKLLEVGLWWKVVSELAPYIDLTICDLKNKLNNLEISQTREENCIQRTQSNFRLAVSYAYTTKEKYIKAKTDIGRMFEHIRESLKQIIEDATWIDKMTKTRALRKLQSMKSFLVYPIALTEANLLNDLYKDVNITNNLYDVTTSINKNKVKRDLEIQNRTNDLDQVRRDLSEVSAFYTPTTNTITIQAGILGLSFYNNGLRALDYGGIGSVVGHEITHGFDNRGRQYNETGGIEDWWQNDTLSSYKEKAQCFVYAYGNYSTNFGNITQKTYGLNSLGENIADNGGFKESLFAYRRGVAEYGEEPILPHFENFTHEQLLTLTFANIWCENPTPESAASVLNNVHSPNPIRVNGVLQNSKEFAEIWKCPKGSKMNPKEKCSLW